MRRIALLLFAATALAGCGSSGISGSDRSAIRATVMSYFRAIAAGDGPRACTLMTPAAQRKAAADAAAGRAGNTCAAGMAQVSRRLSAGGGDAAIAGTTVRAITPKGGDHATATLRIAGANGGFVYVRKIGGRWLVANGATD